MSFKVLAWILMLPFVVSVAEAQIPHTGHSKGEVKWNPFDPGYSIVNPKEGNEVVKEYEGEGSDSERGISGDEDNESLDN